VIFLCALASSNSFFAFICAHKCFFVLYTCKCFLCTLCLQVFSFCSIFVLVVDLFALQLFCLGM
jgi:hypothetical protein